jgi:sortase (surface protein transpeptidase)
LVTCYPFSFVGSAPRRFLVRAVEIERSADAAPEGGADRSGTS